MDVIIDPYDKVMELDELFAQRRVFMDCLLKAPAIKLNFQNLIIVLSNL